MSVADQAVFAVAALLALAVLAATLRSRRNLVRRLVAVTQRLDAAGVADDTTRVEAALNGLERAADAAMVASADALVVAQRYAGALRRMPHGVVVADEAGAPVLQNRRAQQLMRARHSEVLAARVVDELLRAAAEGRAGSETVELFGPPRRTLAISAQPLDDEGRPVGAVATIEDLSERRRLEAVRRDFVANMSHELKTPIGGLGLLAEAIAGEDDMAVVQRLAARMHGEALRVGRIIDDLLDLTRIESEEAPVREPVPVHLVVADAVERVRPSAEHRDIEIHITEPPRRLRVVGDRRQLVSAVHHLVENAVKYSEPGHRVEVEAAAEGDNAVIVVRDRGIGIPARDLDRIFERFYRVDRSRARDTGGTGLGLAIVRHIVVNHGGEVRVESREGEGSTFTLILPAAARTAGTQ